jgi:hypothetical protein
MKAVVIAIIAALFSVPGQGQSQTVLAELPSAPVAPGLNLTTQNVQAGAAPGHLIWLTTLLTRPTYKPWTRNCWTGWPAWAILGVWTGQPPSC